MQQQMFNWMRDHMSSRIAGNQTPQEARRRGKVEGPEHRLRGSPSTTTTPHALSQYDPLPMLKFSSKPFLLCDYVL
jgi:hypothetical protein